MSLNIINSTPDKVGFNPNLQFEINGDVLFKNDYLHKVFVRPHPYNQDDFKRVGLIERRDERFLQAPFLKANQWLVDGVRYSTVDELIAALLPILYIESAEGISNQPIVDLLTEIRDSKQLDYEVGTTYCKENEDAWAEILVFDSKEESNSPIKQYLNLTSLLVQTTIPDLTGYVVCNEPTTALGFEILTIAFTDSDESGTATQVFEGSFENPFEGDVTDGQEYDYYVFNTDLTNILQWYVGVYDVVSDEFTNDTENPEGVVSGNILVIRVNQGLDMTAKTVRITGTKTN